MKSRNSNLITPCYSKSVERWLGAENASLTLVEFGDYQNSQCRAAHRVVKELIKRFGKSQFKFIYRHFPLTQIHPQAERAAEAAEAAGEQGLFWQMHEMLLEHNERLTDADLVEYANKLDLDVPQFLRALSEKQQLHKVRADLRCGLDWGVSGTPTFFINGVLHDAAWNIDALHEALESANKT